MLAMACLMTATSGISGSPNRLWPAEHSTTKTGYPKEADFERMDKAQAKRDRKAQKRLANLPA
jgi:hypothetical protein